MLTKIKNHLYSIILFVFWSVITVFNLRGYWMLVDDGEGVVFARTLFEKLSSLNLIGFSSQLLETNGRFRPIYWLYQMAVWFIGRNSYQFHHFAHMLVIGAGMVTVYLIVNLLTKSKLMSFFASLFILLTPLNTENIFRLGPQEPLLVVLFGILFILLIKNKNIFWPSLVLVFAIFTKETSIALLPVLFIYYVVSKKSRFVKNKKQGFYLWIAVCISAIVMVLTTFLRRSGYSTNYTFDFQLMIGNLIVYLGDLTKNTSFIFPSIFIIYIIRAGVDVLKTKKIFKTKLDLFEFIFFAGFILFLGIQLPWKYALVRYLMPAGFFLIIFSFIEIYRDIQLIDKIRYVKKHKQILTLLITLFAMYVYLLMALTIVFKASGSVSNYAAFKKMSQYPRNVTLLMNMRKADSTIELVYETQVHLSEFWNRDDIKVEYLDLKNLPKDKYIIVDSDQFPRATPRETLNNMFMNKFNLIENNSRTLIITTPIELVKQVIKKLFNVVVHKKQFTGEGIYTYYYSHSNWYFYND